MADDVKKFYCGTSNICKFKEHYINNRCFAPYVIRQSCLYIVRTNGKTKQQGSNIRGVLSESR